MCGFIEVTAMLDRKRIAIAIDSIRMITEEDGYTRILFKSLSGHNFDNRRETVIFPTGVALVCESYDIIKQKITEASGCYD